MTARSLSHNANLRWCSDGFEITCDNAEKVRIAFALDCCDREAVGHIATTEGIKGEDVRDLMVAAVEQRFGPINRLPATIEWLTDNGSCYIAGDTRKFAREDRLRAADDPRGKPTMEWEWPRLWCVQIKRDYVRVDPTPDARNRHPIAVEMVRPLQPTSPASRAGLYVRRVSSLPIGQSIRLWSPCSGN